MSFPSLTQVLHGPGGKLKPTAVSSAEVSSNVNVRRKVLCSCRKVDALQLSQRLTLLDTAGIGEHWQKVLYANCPKPD
jgi:hypothetical protein